MAIKEKATHCIHNGKQIALGRALQIRGDNKKDEANPIFFCVECGEGVWPHESEKIANHFEHFTRNPDCSFSHTKGDIWSRSELKDTVQAYLTMLKQQKSEKSVTKKSVYLGLSKKIGRTEKSIEYRFQNISYVLALLGRDWIPGLPPAKNVGAKTGAVIEALIAELEGTSAAPVVANEIQVKTAKFPPGSKRPEGSAVPSASTTATTIYARDPKVKAWVLARAKGFCELCSDNAPFLTADETPFLEVHHVRKLADKGSDRVTNAVALCPNCHRAMHYAKDTASLVKNLYKNVSELVCE